MRTLIAEDVRRYPDWTRRWVEFIEECQQIAGDLRLDWTDLNCIQWACQGVEAITGVDLYEPYAGTTGVAGAVRRIRADGFSTLDQLIGSYFKEVPVGMCQQGDMVLVRTIDWADMVATADDAEAAGTLPYGVALANPPFYFAIGPNGLVKGDLYTHGVKAFAVGRVVL